MDIFDEIKARVSMREVLDYYGIYPVRGTNIYRCIVHSPDHKPSANIIKNCEKLHCFSCQWTGDIFDVVQHFEKCNRKDALRIIDTHFNLGVYRKLSHKEKLELARRQRERERERAKKLELEEFERKVRHDIIEQLRLWEQVQRDAHITRGEYRNGTWRHRDLFFAALKKIQWLEWLYGAVCGSYQPECEFSLIYGDDKKEIVKKIRDGEIQI